MFLWSGLADVLPVLTCRGLQLWDVPLPHRGFTIHIKKCKRPPIKFVWPLEHIEVSVSCLFPTFNILLLMFTQLCWIKLLWNSVYISFLTVRVSFSYIRSKYFFIYNISIYNSNYIFIYLQNTFYVAHSALKCIKKLRTVEN